MSDNAPLEAIEVCVGQPDAEGRQARIIITPTSLWGHVLRAEVDFVSPSGKKFVRVPMDNAGQILGLYRLDNYPVKVHTVKNCETL